MGNESREPEFAGIEEIKLVEPSDWVSRQANLRRSGGLEGFEPFAKGLDIGLGGVLGFVVVIDEIRRAGRHVAEGVGGVADAGEVAGVHGFTTR